MIVQTRVDHRLLHGQVAFSWTSALGADCILIANDAVPKDDLRKTTLKLAKPAGVKLVIKTVDDSIKAINSGVTDKYKLFIITETIADAKRLIDGCPHIKTLNLGGTRSGAGRKQVSKAVFVDDKDCQAIEQMADRGVDVEIRMVPDDRRIQAIQAIAQA